MKKWILLVWALSMPLITYAQWEKLPQPEGGDVVGMTELDGTFYISIGNTIYTSSDNGDSWQESRNGIPEGSGITVLESTESAVFAAVINDIGDNLFVTTDGGANWSATGGLGPSVVPIDFASKEDTLYMSANFGSLHRSVDDGASFTKLIDLGIGGHFKVVGNKVYGMVGSTMVVSEDGGDTFSEAIGTTNDLSIRFGRWKTVTEFDSTIYAGMAKHLITLNEDSVWTKIDIEFTTGVINEIFTIDTEIWVISDDKIYFSADTAKTWTEIENSPSTGNIRASIVREGQVHIGASDGVFISDSDISPSVQFEKKVSGLTHITTTKLVELEDRLYILGPKLGLLSTDDEGETFSQMGGELLGEANIAGLIKTNENYFASAGFNIYKSEDGVNWNSLGQGGHTLGTDGEIILTTRGNQIAKSVDEGETWVEVTQNFQFGAAVPVKFTFHEEVIFATYSNVSQDPLKSTDGGDTWVRIEVPGILNAHIEFIGDVAYASSGTIFTGGGVAYSEDFGETWVINETILSDDVVGALGLDVSSDGSIYTYTTNGVFRSSDGTESWEEIGTDGLGNAITTQGGPFVHHKNSLFVGLEMNSVFKAPANGMGTSREEEKEIASEYRLLQNYPNPFNPSTAIIFNLPEAGDVNLKVFNMLGQEVATLVEERMSSGEQTIQFDASDLASGMYIYRLQAGSFTQTRKMMLIK